MDKLPDSVIKPGRERKTAKRAARRIQKRLSVTGQVQR